MRSLITLHSKLKKKKRKTKKIYKYILTKYRQFDKVHIIHLKILWIYINYVLYLLINVKYSFLKYNYFQLTKNDKKRFLN